MGEPEANSSDYDVIVVGSGPAGISAAINVANRQRTVALMGGQTPFGRLRKAHVVANYPGFGSVSGDELAEAFVRHLGEFQVPVIEEKASKIIPAEDGFVVFTEREFYQARALVLATGVYREAGIEGEEDLVGQGVSYCVTCDGRLFRGRRAAFISYAAEGEDEASVLAEDYGVAHQLVGRVLRAIGRVIGPVAYQWHPRLGRLGANLMFAPRFQSDADQGIPATGRHRREMGHGRKGGADHREQGARQ